MVKKGINALAWWPIWLEALSHKSKGCRFDPWSGQVQEATN